MAKGMLHLHIHNVIHADLKAGNVMFKTGGEDGRGYMAKLVDFGLSVHMVSLSITWSACPASHKDVLLQCVVFIFLLMQYPPCPLCRGPRMGRPRPRFSKARLVTW